MARIAYIEKTFRGSSLRMIQQANVIIEEYEAQGFTLTLRQLYYQFVSRDLLANKQSEYKRLGSIINDARLAGLIDWNSMEDRTRSLMGKTHYEDPAHFLRNKAYSYATNTREGQEDYLEVWVEKDALTGVINDVCYNNDVDYFACRGYVSQSEQHVAALRILSKLQDNDHQNAIILHLGDHDPSGIDMTRDIVDRMKLFLGHYGFAGNFEIKRLALNMEQVEHYNPPPNPAKLTDSRCAGYMAVHGDSSWELDALQPRVISNLVRDAIHKHTDTDMRQERIDYQETGRSRLLQIAEDYYD